MIRSLPLWTKYTGPFGLKINYDKSTIYRIGSLKYTDAKLVTQRTLSWSNDPMYVLGVYVHEDVNVRINLNFEDLFDKVKECYSDLVISLPNPNGTRAGNKYINRVVVRAQNAMYRANAPKSHQAFSQCYTGICMER